MHDSPSNRPARRAFTFVEVLFAIIILGVGMIMIAAMLPVAIKQSDETLSEVRARIAAENMWSNLRATMQAQDLHAISPPPDPPRTTPYPETVYAIGTDPFFSAVALTLISGTSATDDGIIRATPLTDPLPNPLGRRGAPNETNEFLSPELRSALGTAVAEDGQLRVYTFARRTSNAVKQAEVVFVVTRPRIDRAYSAADLTDADFGPFVTRIEVEPDPSVSPTTPLTPYVVLLGGSGADLGDEVADVGAFLVVRRHSRVTGVNAREHEGRILRLGTRRTDLDGGGQIAFELDPAFAPPLLVGPDNLANTSDDLHDLNLAAPRDAEAFIIGRQFDPDSGNYVGPAQDLIAVRMTLPLDR